MPRSELPKRFPLYSPLQSRNGDIPLTKDAHLVNGYVELDPEDGEYWIYKRLGIAPAAHYGFAISAGPQVGRGIYQSPALATSIFSLVSVFGQQTYVGPAGPVGPVLDNAGGAFTFESVTVNPGVGGSTVATGVVMNNTVRQYLLVQGNIGYNMSDITSQIPRDPSIATAFSLVPGWAFLDGTLYCMDIFGNIRGSNLNDPTTWNPLNVIKASSNADLGVAIAKQLNYVVAFKQDTTQIFFDNANPVPGSPLSPVPDSQIPLGCCAGYSVQKIDDTLLWLSSNETVSPQLVQMDNLIPKVVSTPPVERLLNSFLNGFIPINMQNDTRAWVIKHGGHRFYALTSISQNITLVYDLDQKSWYVWTDNLGNFFPYIATSYQGAVGGGIGGPHLIQHATDGNVYQIDTSDVYPNDLGKLVPVDIYTPNFDGRVDRSKTLYLLRFNSDQTPGSVLNARYNDNDYDPNKWSNFRNVDLSQERPFLDNEGSFYRRAYHFRHRCNTALRIKSGDLYLGLGTL